MPKKTIKFLFTSACICVILTKYGLADAQAADTPTGPWHQAIGKKGGHYHDF